MHKNRKSYFNALPTMAFLGQMDKSLEFRKKLEKKEEEKALHQKGVLASIECQLPELIDEKCKGRLIVFSKYD